MVIIEVKGHIYFILIAQNEDGFTQNICLIIC